MAIIFAEGFDHYGTVQYNPTAGPDYGEELTDSQSRYNMLSGVWLEVPASAKVRYAGEDVGGYPFVPRTGRASLGFLTGTNTVHLRRTLFDYKGTGGDFIGVAFAVWMAQLPTDPGTQVLISFLDSETMPNVAFLLQPDGSITANVPHRWATPQANNWNDTPNDLPAPSGMSGSVEVGSTLPGAFVAGTWVHLEVKVAIGAQGDPDPGQVFLRVNEEELIAETDVNTIGTKSTGTATWEDMDAYVSQVSFLYNYSQETDDHLPIFLDDIVCWDSTGTNCVTDWVGDKNVVLQQLAFDFNDDAALANDWGIVGGDTTPKDAIDDFNDPNIWVNDPYDDAVIYPPPYYNGRDEETYLVADTVGDTSEFGLDVPATVTDILAAIPVNSMRKTQASTTKAQASLVDPTVITSGSFVVGRKYAIVNPTGTDFVTEHSASALPPTSNTAGVVFIAAVVGTGTGTAEAVVAGTDRPIAQDFTYYHDVFERDPSGNAWTPATLNDAQVRIKRTA